MLGAREVNPFETTMDFPTFAIITAIKWKARPSRKRHAMKNYLAVFTGTKEGRANWDKLDPQTRKQREQQGMQAWQEWANKNKSAIVEMGSPLGKTKRVDASGIKDTSNAMAAWTIVQAESHEAAAKLFEKHPHFTIFPGEAVEIMECLPIPGM